MTFRDKVLKAVSSIPYGFVASYGQVAAMVGEPRSARQVGWILNRYGDNIPWWRVINRHGQITIKGSEFSALDQKERLASESITFLDEFVVDIAKHRYIYEA